MGVNRLNAVQKATYLKENQNQIIFSENYNIELLGWIKSI